MAIHPREGQASGTGSGRFRRSVPESKTFRGKAPFGHWLTRIGPESDTITGGKRDGSDRIRWSPSRTGTSRFGRSRTEEPEKAAEILHALLEKLPPPRDRLVLMLRYIENRSIEETAELTGWTRTMVKVQAWRARNKLKKLFEAAGLGGGAMNELEILGKLAAAANRETIPEVSVTGSDCSNKRCSGRAKRPPPDLDCRARVRCGTHRMYFGRAVL